MTPCGLQDCCALNMMSPTASGSVSFRKGSVMSQLSRRTFLGTAAAGVALTAGFATRTRTARAQEKKGGEIRYGLVTYQWAKDWDLPTLIENCATAKVLGVELRTTHKHGVEPNLTGDERADVRKRFADSPVKFLGIGSNERYDSPDLATVKQAIEATKAFIELSHDVGGSGVSMLAHRPIAIDPSTGEGAERHNPG